MSLSCLVCKGVDYGVAVTEMPLFDQLPSRSVLCIFQDSDGDMWFGTEDGLCRDNGYSIRSYRPSASYSGINNNVTGIVQASDGMVWFGTSRGVYRVDKRTQEVIPVMDDRIDNVEIRNIYATSDGSVWVGVDGALLRFSSDGTRIKDYQIQWNNAPSCVRSMYEDRSGRIWIAVWDGGLCRYEPSSDSWIYYPWPYKEGCVGLLQDRSHDFFYVSIWLKGIARFDPDAGSVDDMFSLSHSWSMADERDNAYLCMEQDDVKGYLWAATVNGLQVYDSSDPLALRPIDPKTFGLKRYQMLTDLYKDRDGNIWVAGFNVPSFVVSISTGAVTYPLSAVHSTSGHTATVSGICYDDEPGLFWIFQERHRLYLYDMSTDRIESEIPNLFSDTHNNLGAIYMMIKSRRYRGVWAASTMPAGIYRLSQDDRRIMVTDRIPFSGIAPKAMFEDMSGQLWIGSEGGLYIYVIDSRELIPVDDIGSVVDITASPSGDVVVAAYDSSGQSYIYTYHGRNRISGRRFNGDCTAVAVTSDNSLWIGTRLGEVWRLANHEDAVRLSECSDFTSAGYVRGLVTDSCGHLWIQTEQRLTELEPSSLSMRHYYVNEGYIGLFNFFPRTYAVLPSGELIFGGAGGFCRLESTPSLSDLEADAAPVINYVKVDGSNVPLPDSGEALELTPGDHTVEIEFGTSDHLGAKRKVYAYRIGDTPCSWISMAPGHNVVHLSRLEKGAHRLELRSLGSDPADKASIASLLINRQPAFHETWWFLGVILLLCGSAVWTMVWFYNRHKTNERNQRMEAELVQLKFNFFTNITHELRTPLSLIITPLDALIRRSDNADTRKQLINIRRNAGELLKLINRTLSFRRLEMGGERLSVLQGDLAEFVGNIVESFRPLAEEKQVDLSLESDGAGCCVGFDAEKFRIIINNLLSNAFKFTEPGDAVKTSVCRTSVSGRDWIVIRIADTGCGIPERDIPHIMDVFYQSASGSGVGDGNAGSGIGLYVVNEYVKMHGGKVEVHSRQGEGTEFAIWLPVSDADVSDSAVASESDESASVDEIPEATSRKTVLLVEDNQEFREFMRNELSDQYDVVEASDGMEGEDMALQFHPDVIISDVMMPRRDGFELCRAIKNNVDTSSIPVILLSARIDRPSEIRGYESRADVYLTKPFNLGILLNRIEYLIARQSELRQEFKEVLETDPKKITISPLDKELLTRILACVEKNMTNSNYGIAELSRDVNMSRMNLYRKLQAITGQTPTDFVKTVRLKKAAIMLRERKCSIVEVAYAVGYSSPSYFTRSFKGEFGLTPSQYIERAHHNGPSTPPDA